MEIAAYIVGILAGILLTVFSVLYSSHKTHSLWLLFLPSLLLFSLAGTMYWHSQVKEEEEEGMRTEREQNEPTFSETVEKFQLTLGTNTVTASVSSLQKRSFEPINLDGHKPFRMYVDGRRLYVDVQLYGGKDAPPVELRHNQFVVQPENWDRNSSDSALEVVNQDGAPMLQVIYKSRSHIVVNGVFKYPGGLVLIDEDGMYGNPSRPKLKLKRIFKYPSWKFPGHYAE